MESDGEWPRESVHSTKNGLDIRFLMRTAEIFGIPIALTRKEALIGVVDSLLRSGRKGWICYANVHTLNLALSYPWLRRFYRSALLNYCDGMGVKLGGRLLGIQIPERLTRLTFLMIFVGMRKSGVIDYSFWALPRSP